MSPVLQGSLGNLPPLYIIAGEGEVLRDEIIYLAHKAAHPKDYPASASALKSRRQKENAEKYTEPTRVCQPYNTFSISFSLSALRFIYKFLTVRGSALP